tara:strand:+ start:951 stop:1568 length:618 start_codon:yes stop_codon:yes gene_type:complete
MKKMILVSALLLMPCLSSAATLTTYTNQAAFEAATSTSTYDFNSDANGSFTSKDFGDFTATLQNPYSGFLGTYKPSIYNQALKLQKKDEASALEISFDSTISAFGFNWENTDWTGDAIEVSILGQNFVFGPNRQSGFFGITSDTLFSTALLGDSVGSNEFLFTGTLDNFQYGNVSAVPIPAAAFLFAPAMLGFMGLRRKAKKLVV